MPPDRPNLSVVIPAFNEADRLPMMLATMLAYLRGKNYLSEIIVVDDGSTDETAALAARSGTPELPVHVLRNSSNEGKGFSIRRGVLSSRGLYVLFCDADGSTGLEALELCWPAVRTGSQVVIGSRHLPTSRIIRYQPWMRRQMSALFRWLANRILLSPVTDIMCGFKFFEAAAAKAIFSRVTLTQWAFDAEILFIAQSLGMAIREVPVTWTNDARTRVCLSVDSWRAFAGLLRIRWNASTNRYHGDA